MPAASLQPSRLVLYERYENGLHAIVTELADKRMGQTVPVLGDVTDRDRLDEVLVESIPRFSFTRRRTSTCRWWKAIRAKR